MNSFTVSSHMLWKPSSSLSASPKRSAFFLIAVFLFTLFVGRVAGSIWDVLRDEAILPEATWRDLFTWPGLRSALISLGDDFRWFIGTEVLEVIVGIVVCLLATTWLHSISWKLAFAKLGLPRPVRAELTLPLAATLPGLVVVFVAFGPEPWLASERIVLSPVLGSTWNRASGTLAITRMSLFGCTPIPRGKVQTGPEPTPVLVTIVRSPVVGSTRVTDTVG